MAVKVLHIMGSFGGGISSFIWNKVNAMDKEKVVFDILTYDECSEDFKKVIYNMGGEIFHMPNPKEIGWKAFYSAVNDVMEQKNTYEMVHCHISGYRALPFRIIAKKNKLNRFIIHAHTSSNPLVPEKKIEKINRKLNGVLATEKVSCGIRASNFIFGTKFVEEKKIMHIPNSIDDSVYFNDSDSNLKEEVLGEAILSKPLIIGHVGRFKKVKNHKFMIEIMLELQELKIDFLWLFIGNGELLEDVKSEIKEYKLQDKVKFMGRREDVESFYKIMDVFVLPSFHEGFPTVAVEAQAAGTPAILSESISNEVDLGMGLVDFCSVNNGPATWIDSILQSERKEIPSVESRRKIIEHKKFSNSSSAKLYESFVLGEIKHYEI